MLYLILTSEIADQVREQLASAVPVYVPIERVGALDRKSTRLNSSH